jgi:DNA topoisomerase-2
MALKDVSYIPAMLKIIDEVISNSCDEFRRKDNLGLTELRVSMDPKAGKIIVRDNGGIAVAKHKDAGCYLTEFIFGRLRTSSNYDDTEDRNVIGTNGVGSSLANIFSSKFVVTTADKKKKITVSWENNMRNCTNHGTPEACKDHFTETEFYIDFSKFDVKKPEFTSQFVEIIHKRCIDAAAANLGLKVIFETPDYKEEWKFKNFSEYMDLYSDFISINSGIEFEDSNIHCWIFPDSNLNVGFVNGAACNRGTHFKAVRNIVNNSIAEYIKKKEKIEVTTKGIDNKYSVFCNANVSNPAYSSQTKEELTTPVNKFVLNGTYETVIPEKVLNKINRSEIVATVIDWFKQKTAAEDAKAIRQLNRQSSKSLKRPDKYV